MKDLKKTAEGHRPEVMRVVGDVQKLVERERQSVDPTVQQLVKKLRRSASDTQIRYKRVQLRRVFSAK